MRTQALLVFTLAASLLPPAAAQQFTDRSDLLHYAPPPSVLILGASFADVNNDGLVDLYHPGRLLINEGEAGFTDLRAEMGLGDEGDVVFGAIFGDYDGDGWLDVFMEDLQPPSFLFRNAGGRFVRADSAAGLRTDALLAQGSSWGDFDNDGRLDLFAGGDDGVSHLFFNRGNGRFSSPAFIRYDRNVYGVVASDYDRDGDLDLFLAPCHSLNPARSVKVLLRNNGEGRFTDVAAQAGVADDQDSWGVTSADVNNDGWFDFYVGNFPRAGTGTSGTNRLYLNNRNRTFTDVAATAGVAGPAEAYTWSVAAADFDNDGLVDLYALSRSLAPVNSFRHQLFRNNGNGRFTDVTAASGIDTDLQAGAVGDVNGDGWIDVFATGITANNTEHNRIFLNDGGSNHWLVVHLRQPGDNHYAIGALVEVWAGFRVNIREIVAGDGFTSQSHALRAHVGLGRATRADSLIVRWPGGAVERIYDVAADQQVTVARGRGLDAPPAAFALTAPADGATAGLDAVTLAWEPAPDPESGAVTYTVYLHGPDSTQTFAAGVETQLVVPASALSEGAYTWNVAATDGTSIRGSLGRPWLFNASVVATEPYPSAPARPSLDVFPNPARGQARVHLGLTAPAPVRAVLYDALGRAVRVVDAGARPASGRWTLETRGLPPGVYVLRVDGAFGSVSRPFVVLP